MTNQIATIYDIMRQTSKFAGNRYHGEVGIEVETETMKSYEYPTLKYWNCEKDGSLRDWGVEYILREPLGMTDLEKALVEFSQCDKKFKFKTSSISTSVHVHVNMLNETYLTLANFITTYALMENLLIRYSGPDRLSNLFCLPICDCEGVKDALVQILGLINRGLYGKATLSPDRVKYGAINAAPLSKLGTIEVRSFRGETDVDVIQKWVDIILKMKTFAKRPGLTPPQILMMWKEHREKLVEVVFQQYSKELQVLDKEKNNITGALIIENLKHASSIAAVSKDWTKFGILKIKPVYKEMIKPQLDEIAQSRFKGPFNNLSFHERLLVIEIYERSQMNAQVMDAPEDI